ncbi:GNAT family N-acetyltransferase [Aliikangiella sp. IMCC44653]
MLFASSEQLPQHPKYQFSVIQPNDLTDYIDVFNCPLTMRYIRHQLNHTELTKLFNHIVNSTTQLYFKLRCKSSQHCIGFVGASIIDQATQTVELGIVIKHRILAKGEGRQIGISMVNNLFYHKGVQRIHFKTRTNNRAVILACRSVNAKPIATQPKSNYVVYGVDKSAWEFKPVAQVH